jgi:hypothetical protein
VDTGVRVPDFNYRHRIEYRRVTLGGRQVHEHTEVVDDHGWYIGRSGMTRQQWRERYTVACAEDFLPRMRAAAGRWVVSVYRLPTNADDQFVCAVHLTWPQKRTAKNNDNRRRPG